MANKGIMTRENKRAQICQMVSCGWGRDQFSKQDQAELSPSITFR